MIIILPKLNILNNVDITLYSNIKLNKYINSITSKANQSFGLLEKNIWPLSEGLFSHILIRLAGNIKYVLCRLWTPDINRFLPILFTVNLLTVMRMLCHSFHLQYGIYMIKSGRG